MEGTIPPPSETPQDTMGPGQAMGLDEVVVKGNESAIVRGETLRRDQDRLEQEKVALTDKMMTVMSGLTQAGENLPGFVSASRTLNPRMSKSDFVDFYIEEGADFQTRAELLKRLTSTVLFNQPIDQPENQRALVCATPTGFKKVVYEPPHEEGTVNKLESMIDAWRGQLYAKLLFQTTSIHGIRGGGEYLRAEDDEYTLVDADSHDVEAAYGQSVERAEKKNGAMDIQNRIDTIQGRSQVADTLLARLTPQNK